MACTPSADCMSVTVNPTISGELGKKRFPINIVFRYFDNEVIFPYLFAAFDLMLAVVT